MSEGVKFCFVISAENKFKNLKNWHSRINEHNIFLTTKSNLYKIQKDS